MKISDEIREVCDISVHDEIRAFADRIDAEMVERPRSADGKIWTGREVCFWTGSEDEDWNKFCGLYYNNGEWYAENVDRKRYPAVSVWYERPDSLERIADDIEESKGTVLISENTLDGWAYRIRKLAAKEDK